MLQLLECLFLKVNCKLLIQPTLLYDIEMNKQEIFLPK